MLLNVKRFQFVANNINRADFNDRCQSMSNVSPDKGPGQGKVNIDSHYSIKLYVVHYTLLLCLEIK